MPRNGFIAGVTRRRVGLICAALAVGLLSACSDGSENSDAPPGSEAPPRTDAPAGTEAPPGTEVSAVPETTDPELLPLAWFIGHGFTSEPSVVRDAIQVLTTRCMNEAGFEVPDSLAPTQQEETPSVDRLKYWYGLIDPEEAAVDGYTGSSPNPIVHPGEDMTDEERSEALFPDPARREAYFVARDGTDSDVVSREVVDPITGESHGSMSLGGGCAGEARRTVYGGAEGALTLSAGYQWLDLQIVEIRAEAEAAARDAWEAWLACMTANGYPATHRFWGQIPEEEGLLGASPSDGPSSSELPEPRPSSEEIAMAVADTMCKDESGWTRSIFETEFRLQSELAAAAAEFIATARAVEDAAVTQATEILNEG